jgi:hypothetical protein
LTPIKPPMEAVFLFYLAENSYFIMSCGKRA